MKDHPDHPADIQCSICKLLIREGGTPQPSSITTRASTVRRHPIDVAAAATSAARTAGYEPYLTSSIVTSHEPAHRPAGPALVVSRRCAPSR